MKCGDICENMRQNKADLSASTSGKKHTFLFYRRRFVRLTKRAKFSTAKCRRNAGNHAGALSQIGKIMADIRREEAKETMDVSRLTGLSSY